jgi:hypothetical protein
MSLFPSFGTPQYRSADVSPRVPLDTSVCASTAAALADFLLHEGHKPVAACSTPGPCLLESWRASAPQRSCCLYWKQRAGILRQSGNPAHTRVRWSSSSQQGQASSLFASHDRRPAALAPARAYQGGRKRRTLEGDPPVRPRRQDRPSGAGPCRVPPACWFQVHCCPMLVPQAATAALCADEHASGSRGLREVRAWLSAMTQEDQEAL